MAEFDLIDNFGWVMGAAGALLFGVSFVVAAVDRRGKVNISNLQLVLAQVILAVLGIYTTVWCYHHPERASAQPIPFLWDPVVCFACVALFEGAVIFYFLRRR
jgi:hypothetical protein